MKCACTRLFRRSLHRSRLPFHLRRPREILVQILTVIAFIFAFTPLQAQQELKFEQLPEPERGYVSAVLIASDGTWWIGVQGGVFCSIDRGASWQFRGLSDAAVTAILEYGPDTLIAGGSSGAFISTDAGEHWDCVVYENISAIAIAPDRSIIIGTTDEFTPDGVLWSPSIDQSFHSMNKYLYDQNILCMLMHPSGRLFVGTHAGIFYMDTLGTQWTHVNDQHVAGYCDALAAAPDGRIYASIYQHVPAMSSDGGITWQQLLTAPVVGYSPALTAPTDEEIVMAINFSGIYRSKDGGEQWEDATANLKTPRGVDLALAPTGEWILATGDGVYVSRDDMESWEESNRGLVAATILAITSDSQGLLFAGGPSGVQRSSDGGLTWTDIDDGLPGRNIKTVVAYSSKLIISVSKDHGPCITGAAALGPENSVWTSTDAGDTWNPGGSSIGTIFDIVPCGMGTLCASYNGPGVAISTDQGYSWSAVSVGETNLKCRSLAAKDWSEVLAVMEDGLYHSVDDGYSWTCLSPHAMPNLKSAFRTSDGTLLLGTLDGMIMRSTNNGLTWPVVFQSGYGWVTDFLEYDGMVYATVDREGVLCSTDSGSTWVLRNTGLSKPYYQCMALSADKRILVGTFGGGIFRSQSLVPVGVADMDPAVVRALLLHATYPNPCSTVTTIPYTIKSSVRVRAEILDMQGRVVAKLYEGEREPGIHYLDWRDIALPSGQYQCRISAGTETATRMISVVR